MLNQKELVDALMINLSNWNWDIYSKFPIDQDTGKALVEEWKQRRNDGHADGHSTSEVS